MIRWTKEETMKKATAITCMFLDIGGVLLTDGWSRSAGKLAAKEFGLSSEELNKRHNEALDVYELGKLTLEEYLRQVVFYERRPFTPAQFRKFMFAQSKPYPEVINLVRRLKAQYGLKIVVVSNEGRGLNEYRIRKFKLDEFVDSFISSCFVQLRKPDADIFRVALDTAQVQASQVIYIENTRMFVEVAESLGIRSILHTDYKSTCAKLASFGLRNDEGVTHETR
jgi:HAD superfamily hydrolase (TIGR01509 family)